MANCETQQGFFFMVLGVDREVLCHRCAKCASFTMCGDGQVRAFCCGRWVVKPEEGFWAGRLPRIPYIPPRGLTVLPSNDISFSD
jgi:hypothetical protein